MRANKLKNLLTLSIFISWLSFRNLHAIEITEIMANPKGKDENQEWIEIFNPEDQDKELKNYKIKIGDQYFEFTENQKIKKNSYLLIENSSRSFTLKNSENTIQLLDKNLKIIEEINYQKTEEGKSYSKIKIQDLSGKTLHTLWSNQVPSKSVTNPTIYFFKGRVTSGIEKINEEKYFFEIEITNNEQKKEKSEQERNQKMVFTKTAINPLLAELLLKKGQKIKILAKKNFQGSWEILKIKRN